MPQKKKQATGLTDKELVEKYESGKQPVDKMIDKALKTAPIKKKPSR